MSENNLIKLLQHYSLFEGGGLFSKKISLSYKAISKQPWLNFNCLEKDKYSFKIHELEMGDEAMLWHVAAQQNKKVSFQGFLTFGNLRGYLTIPRENYKIGVLVNSGRIEKLVNQKEIEEMYDVSFSFIAPFFYNIATQKNDFAKGIKNTQ